MKKTTSNAFFVIFIFCLLIVVKSSAQFSFTNSNSLIPTASHSGCAVTVADINNDGLDDIVKMDQSTTLIIELQNKNGTFTHYNLGSITGTSRVWGMAVADVDHNGWKDVATGTNGSMRLVKLSWTGSTIAADNITLSGSYFVQNITFGDFNNDGWVDLAVCDDNDFSKIYQNDGIGNLAETTTLINTEINPGLTYGNDPYDSGNYGSVWTDFDNDGDLDLYIAHCRQSTTSSSDQRRRDRLFVNDGNGGFTEQAQAHGIETTVFLQTWTTSFGDLDNDGDQDIVMTNHGVASQILQNDGTGHYTDVTAGSGFTIAFDAIESVLEDFDNDGFLDILISGPNWVMYRNNGNGTFTQTPGVFAGTGLLSFGIGDLNHDGKIDVFSTYGNVYNNPTTADDVLYMNTTKNSNHFISFDLKGTTSNMDAIGAKVSIYGPWGIQVREVRAGESYGTANSMHLHFGLGANTMIDSARINWPSHATTHFGPLAADQFVTAIEGVCSITGNIIPGPFVICQGQSLNLTTGSGFTAYEWSNGDISSSIVVSSSGMFNVKVTSADGCTNISPSVNVELNPDQTPTVTASSSELNICEGSTMTLTSSSGSSYLWSNGNITQSITVDQTGDYSVTVQGVCQAWTSSVTSVNVYPAPAPAASDVNLTSPGTANLNAIGNSISWYDVPTGGSVLGTGSSFTTAFLSQTQYFYAEDAYSYGGGIDYVGQPNYTGTSPFSSNTTNAYQIFEVIRPCILKTVKVYTDSPGNRIIELRNSSGTVLQSATVFIPADTVMITLNFSLTPGTNYRLGTNTAQNNTLFGYASPRLRRSSSGVAYPYTLNNFVTITNSNQGPSRFYYFYNWEIDEPPTVCVSARTPVQVTVPLGIQNISQENSVRIFPNPASKIVNVTFDEHINTPTTIEIVDVTGRVISQQVFEQLSAGQTIQLDIHKIAAGKYILNITGKNRLITKNLSVLE